MGWGFEGLVGRDLGPRGEYHIVELLGQGGMAAVYRAAHRTPAWTRTVAIKVLDPYLSSQSGFASRFLREAAIVATLRHPHILAAFDFGDEDGLLYLVMDLIEGGSLQDALHTEGSQPWELERVAQFADGILPALSMAHRRGIIHRDIKPSNILIDAETRFAFLTDFGIAKVVGEEVGSYQTRGFLGTPAYTSPEQVMGEPTDARSDLYSFGILLYRLICGRLPYDGAEPIAIALKHVNGPLPAPRRFNPSIPDPVEQVLTRALARNPAERYQSADELRQALSEAVGRLRSLPPTGDLNAQSHQAVTLAHADIRSIKSSALSSRPALRFLFWGILCLPRARRLRLYSQHAAIRWCKDRFSCSGANARGGCGVESNCPIRTDPGVARLADRSADSDSRTTAFSNAWCDQHTNTR